MEAAAPPVAAPGAAPGDVSTAEAIPMPDNAEGQGDKVAESSVSGLAALSILAAAVVLGIVIAAFVLNSRENYWGVGGCSRLCRLYKRKKKILAGDFCVLWPCRTWRSKTTASWFFGGPAKRSKRILGARLYDCLHEKVFTLIIVASSTNYRVGRGRQQQSCCSGIFILFIY
ncbi:uncharacterized protein [Dermacentor albipictus]|uniref:uncharacterized protein n=1 Tax=Dermacentor albipictus TaxID=60249 RepID=UPI0038FD089B